MVFHDGVKEEHKHIRNGKSKIVEFRKLELFENRNKLKRIIRKEEVKIPQTKMHYGSFLLYMKEEQTYSNMENFNVCYREKNKKVA